jgi:hypothetical protein
MSGEDERAGTLGDVDGSQLASPVVDIREEVSRLRLGWWLRALEREVVDSHTRRVGATRLDVVLPQAVDLHLEARRQIGQAESLGAVSRRGLGLLTMPSSHRPRLLAPTPSP